MLDHEMAIQNHRFDLRQQGILAIDVAPSRLDHSHFCIAEIIHYIFEKARPRREVCIENCDQFACRQFQSVLERTGFESGSVRAVDMTDVETHQTAELLKEINREKTVMVVEHDMTFVRELGVKVTCLHEGTVLAEGTIDQVSSNERVIEVYLGR